MKIDSSSSSSTSNKGNDDDEYAYSFEGYPIKNGIKWSAKKMKKSNYCLPLSHVTPSSSLQWYIDETQKLVTILIR
jgi:hypothetical protein